MTTFLVSIAVLAATAGADIKQIKREMLAERQACGGDAACMQKAMQRGAARLQIALTAVQGERKAARDTAVDKANKERDAHGGRSGGPDGHYLGFPDEAAIMAALKNRTDCLHDVDWGSLSSTPPPVRGPRVTPGTPPRCEMINVYDAKLRYCQLNRAAVAWQMGRLWRDRYWDARDRDHWGALHDSNCVTRAYDAFRASDDVGFRLAVLDFLGDVKTTGTTDTADIAIEKALKTEPPGPVRERLEWLAEPLTAAQTAAR